MRVNSAWRSVFRTTRHGFFIATFVGVLSSAAHGSALDIDANGTFEPLTDGILLIRTLFGFSGSAVTNGALGIGATRTDPVAIVAHVSGNTSAFDVDRNNVVEPLTDGVLIARYLFGFRGNSLIAGSVGVGATATTSTAIESNIVTAMSAPTIGAHALAFKRDGESAGTVSTSALSTQASGSSFITCVGRGVFGAHAPTTDNKSNTYIQIGTAHTYTRFPNSGTACYISSNALGGPGHVVSAPNSAGSPVDETTLTVVEIAGGSQLRDFKWNEVLSSPLASLSVTTTGPATLVAFWWGDGNVDVAHMATPNNGFVVVDSLLSLGALVQVSVATKNVTAAGTYNVTWTSTEGAQLWLMAIQ